VNVIPSARRRNFPYIILNFSFVIGRNLFRTLFRKALVPLRADGEVRFLDDGFAGLLFPAMENEKSQMRNGKFFS